MFAWLLRLGQVRSDKGKMLGSTLTALRERLKEFSAALLQRVFMSGSSSCPETCLAYSVGKCIMVVDLGLGAGFWVCQKEYGITFVLFELSK